ncbi:GNAT family N-acetyltransferase [Jatrophihabitans sp.]|uniref:GNAT family N-acetyltransferase n=1 Tax=Jatrophihabitans sp. TaxID=1932789 RepID=UPI0030C6A4DB|nr:family acetyltransferase [Jatrophihabitans sp.]
MQTYGSYQLDDDPARIDRDAVWDFLSTSAYWGRWRSRADVDGQFDAAWRVVGAYTAGGALVGCCRAISDGYATAYLADVYVLEAHRGTGLGLAMLRELIEAGPGAGFRWMLHTADAHGLYRKLGFAEPGASYLERPAITG